MFKGNDVQPHTRVHHSWQGIAQRVLLAIALLFLLSPVSITIGGDETTFSVINGTRYYLHAIVNNTSFLYIAPQKLATYRTKGPATLLVNVFYTPGQGIAGSVTRTFHLQAYDPGGTSCNQNRSGGCECTTEPPSYGSYRWTVTSDTLQTALSGEEREEMLP